MLLEYLTTIGIIDWDDTLFPSTFIRSHMDWINNPSSMPEIYHNKFTKLSNYIKSLINNMKLYGEVIIITNAKAGWVQTSCKLMPDLLPLLSTISIISARSDWEYINPSPNKWKEFAFNKKIVEILGNNENIIINLICIGDSLYEHDAALNVAHFINTYTTNYIFTKNIKFYYNPSFDILLNEVHNLSIDVELNENKFMTKLKSIQYNARLYSAK